MLIFVLGACVMKIKLSIIFLIVALLNFPLLYADSDNLGYEGYDFYFLNGFDIDVARKNIFIEVDGDKITFSGDYILSNQTEKIIEVVFGLPMDNIENLIITEKSNPIKATRRNRGYIEKNYISEHLPIIEKWSTSGLWLKANENRLINIKYDSKTVNDSKGIYSFIYENNITPGNIINSKVYITFKNFKPYNIINVYNMEVERMSYNIDQTFLNGSINGRAIRVDYELIDKLAIDRLSYSTSKTLKNISNLFHAKDYEGTILLCDDYIKNPSDSSVDINQLKFIKAEAYRKLVKYDNYFDIIKGLDLDKIYPYRLKYKVFSDIDEVIGGDINDTNLSAIMKSIQDDLNYSNEFFNRWIIYNKKDYSNINETIEIDETKETKENIINKLKTSDMINKIIVFAEKNKIVYFVAMALVFLIGLLIGKYYKKKRDRAPYYTFRR